ncbi:MAG: TetR/AcrR family transcriptional regulator, partial [Frankiales bacterium]|nr:TetR/AcrR family transcriptional regulator [Frankiales bacterium]
ARYVVRLEPLASTSADILAPAIGPTLDRYLSGPLG